MEASKEDAAPPQPLLSLVHGPTEPALLKLTLGQLIDHQASKYGSKDAIVVPWTRARLSYSTLKERTESVARGLLALGVRGNDRVGVLCGDDERFIELFFACGRMGAVLVILNKTYTLFEYEAAVQHTSMFFLIPRKLNKLYILTLLTRTIRSFHFQPSKPQGHSPYHSTFTRKDLYSTDFHPRRRGTDTQFSGNMGGVPGERHENSALFLEPR